MPSLDKIEQKWQFTYLSSKTVITACQSGIPSGIKTDVTVRKRKAWKNVVIHKNEKFIVSLKVPQLKTWNWELELEPKEKWPIQLENPTINFLESKKEKLYLVISFRGACIFQQRLRVYNLRQEASVLQLSITLPYQQQTTLVPSSPDLPRVALHFPGVFSSGFQVPKMSKINSSI